MNRFHITTRRDVLTQGLGLVGVGATLPNFLVRTAMAGPQATSDDRVLVVVQLSGGHDGLSAVVPYADDGYGRNRKASRIQENEVLKMNDYVGLHPNLTAFKDLLDQDAFAVVQGVGYPNPNLSHFSSMDIWHLGDNKAKTNSSKTESRYGWIGKYCDVVHPSNLDPKLAISLGSGRTPRALRGREHPGISFSQPQSFRYLGDRGKEERADAYRKLNEMTPKGVSESQDFITRTAIDANASSTAIRELALKHESKGSYPGTALARSLKTVASLIAGGLSTRIYYVFQGGFDTHYYQRARHDNLMTEFGGAIAAFQKDLTEQGNADRVLTMSFSEFGRRVTENGSQGTDHGTAGPMFLFGPGLKGGVYGDHPSLEDDKMVRGRNLAYTTDFRSVYASLLEKWMDAPSDEILGEKFPLIDCIA